MTTFLAPIGLLGFDTSGAIPTVSNAQALAAFVDWVTVDNRGDLPTFWAPS